MILAIIVGAFCGFMLAKHEVDRLDRTYRRLDREDRIGGFKLWLEWRKKEDARLLAMFDDPTPPFYAQFFRKEIEG